MPSLLFNPTGSSECRLLLGLQRLGSFHWTLWLWNGRQSCCGRPALVCRPVCIKVGRCICWQQACSRVLHCIRRNCWLVQLPGHLLVSSKHTAISDLDEDRSLGLMILDDLSFFPLVRYPYPVILWHFLLSNDLMSSVIVLLLLLSVVLLSLLHGGDVLHFWQELSRWHGTLFFSILPLLSWAGENPLCSGVLQYIRKPRYSLLLFFMRLLIAWTVRSTSPLAWG